MRRLRTLGRWRVRGAVVEIVDGPREAVVRLVDLGHAERFRAALDHVAGKRWIAAADLRDLVAIAVSRGGARCSSSASLVRSLTDARSADRRPSRGPERIGDVLDRVMERVGARRVEEIGR